MSVIEKIKGIFTADTDRHASTNPNTPEQQHIWDTVYQDYQIFKSARQPMESIWQQEQRFYMGDHWRGLRSEAVSKLRPDAVENITFSQIESIVGKLTGWMPVPDYSAMEPSDEQKARDLNDYMPSELRQIKFRHKHTRAVRRCVIHGPLIYKTIFDPTIEGGRGLNRYTGRNDILPVDLGTFFPDPRVSDFIYLQDMSALIIHIRKPLEYFKKRWSDQGKKVQPDNTSTDTEIFSTDVYEKAGESSFSTQITDKTSGLIEYWYRGLPKLVSKEDKDLFTEQANEKLMQGIDPSEYLAKAAGDMEGVHCIYVSTSGVFLEHKAYVYDHGEYPFTARTLYPEEGNPWGKGFMRDMIKPQIFKNKYAEIAIETMAKQGGSGIVYEEGAISKPRTWQEQRGLPGAMLPIATGRMNDWKELQGVNVPGTVFNSLNYYDEMLQKIPGVFDSANGASNSNVTSGEQAKALIAASGTRLNTVSDLISEALIEVFTQYVELIAQFYTTERIARVTGRGNVSISRDAIVSRAPTEYDNGGQIPDLMTGDISPNIQQVQEEFVPEFDLNVHIGVDKPQDREYWLQLAFNLLNMKDPITGLPMIDAEGVRYVIQTGRMESMDVIKQRIEEQAGLQQQFMQAQQQAQQLQQENQQMQQALQQLTDQRVQQDQQSKQFEQSLKQQKMELEAAKTANEIMNSNQVISGLR
ncbi:hypothetical protein FHR92_005153 [Fontibacillus solani]|uniref:Portal protein n=1 Tax=Fontibacillus solani TaxID=1572857 RepID=A0A7W3SYP1_9BACL|nr:hypothetical protein [Fontibacillus solani]MBA9088635.1 hypothetical protein [Fontibacillus solani]